MLKLFNQDQRFTALVLAMLALLLTLTGVLNRFDYVFYDLSHYISPKHPPEDIVIVAIDEKSLDALGKWPWSRETHAHLLNQLSKSHSRAIGMDILFSEPDVQHPRDDALLAEAIQRVGNVVLPIVIGAPYEGARIKQENSLPLLVDNAVATGRVNVPLDVDGIARSIYLWEGVARPDADVSQTTLQGLPHLSQSILQAAGMLPEGHDQQSPLFTLHDSAKTLLRSGQKKIQFYGKPGAFKQVSYIDVWSGNIATEYFDEKIILIGATAVGMGDVLATPMSGFSKPMAGVEYNANAIETIRSAKLISDVPLWLSAVISILLAIIPVLWLPKQTPLQSLVIILFYFIALILLSTLLPELFNLWFSPSGVLLAVLLAFPIWSWRRLDRAHAYLDVELQQLKDDLMQYGMQSEPGVADKSQAFNVARYDVLQSRIEHVKYAAQLLRGLQKNRNDTLAFISHDIRMPLATCIMLLNGPADNYKKSRVVLLLEQAIALADNFLSISKAESASTAGFKELEINSLLQEVVDHLYDLARAKKIKLNLTLHDDGLWVVGDFALLHRACANIINNALKFSGENSNIDITLSGDAKNAIIKIKDYGEGIDQAQLPTIFKKFNQLNEVKTAAHGSGLGLYFVDVTIKKHRGEVDVASELGHWTAFTLQLPLADAVPEDD
jgi:CHASE2 domain-containing sensor protein